MEFNRVRRENWEKLACLAHSRLAASQRRAWAVSSLHERDTAHARRWLAAKRGMPVRLFAIFRMATVAGGVQLGSRGFDVVARLGFSGVGELLSAGAHVA